MKRNKRPSPPRLAVWLVKRLERYRINHAIIGDMQEVFTRICRERGIILACLWYWGQSLDAVIKDTLFNPRWRFVMLMNYLKIAWRNIKKYKAFSFINIAGLTVGMASCLFIGLFILHELSFDTHHENSNRIFKVVRSTSRAMTPAPLVPALKENFPEIEEATQLNSVDEVFIRLDNNACVKTKSVTADKHVFDVFSFPLVHGDPETALERPFTMVIDQETANKFFGHENPIGKTVSIQDEDNFQITGIMKNIPKNSHFRAHIFTSFATHRQREADLTDWDSNWIHSYLLLREDCDYRELEQKLPKLMEKYTDREYHGFMLQPLTDIHLKSVDHWSHMEPVSDIKYIYIFTSIAFIILLIVCVNYMNLVTARSLKRSREIGVRKVAGAHRSQLVRQFLSESFLMTFAAFFLAVVLFYVFVKPISDLIGIDMEINLIHIPEFILFILGIVFITTIFSGTYPALFLSKLKTAAVLKGTISKDAKGTFLRNTLVVIQFTISIFLIVVMLVISYQVHFIRNIKLGFVREHVVIVDLFGNKEVRQKRDIIKTELLRNNDIKGVTFSTTIPMNIFWRASADFEGRQEDGDLFSTCYSRVDYDYLDVFGLELVAGRNFSRHMASDFTGGGSYILNETAVNRLGWKEPIGKKFRFSWAEEMGTVIGVVKNFYNLPLHVQSEPVVLRLSANSNRCMSVKIHTENIPEAVASIENVWKRFTSGWPFEYEFMDEAYDKMYKSELRMNNLFRTFSIIAIFLSCLGLFGLASFTAERRTKEIGIRKVLGASVLEVAGLLSKNFTKCVLLANIIAWPVAYFVMNKWLQNFAYRIDLSLWIFVISGFTALVISLLTVSYQTVKAATANPVDSLRYE